MESSCPSPNGHGRSRLTSNFFGFSACLSEPAYSWFYHGSVHKLDTDDPNDVITLSGLKVGNCEPLKLKVGISYTTKISVAIISEPYFGIPSKKISNLHSFPALHLYSASLRDHVGEDMTQARQSSPILRLEGLYTGQE